MAINITVRGVSRPAGEGTYRTWQQSHYHHSLRRLLSDGLALAQVCSHAFERGNTQMNCPETVTLPSLEISLGKCYITKSILTSLKANVGPMIRH